MTNVLTVLGRGISRKQSMLHKTDTIRYGMEHRQRYRQLQRWFGPRFARGLFAIYLLLTTQTCGTETSPSSFEAGPTRSLVAYVHGGFNGCHRDLLSWGEPKIDTMSIATEFSRIKRLAASRGLAVKVFLTCFGKSNQYLLLQLPSGKRLEYKSAAAFLRDSAKGKFHKKDDAVFLLGHSWGGWLALKHALQIGGEDRIEGLVTLDPISAARCGPSELSTSYLQSQWEVQPNPECTRAPSDISAKDYANIALATKEWLHYYQSDYPLLHSGWIAASDTSEMLEQDFPYLLPNLAHNRIAEDPNAWREVIRMKAFK